MGWLIEKAQNSRIYMCIKEVKWDLENADAVRKAMILALAQIVRTEAFGENVPLDVLDRPLDYSRDDLVRFYDILEAIRNQNTLEIAATKKNMHQFEMELPQYAIDHAKITGRGLEVWMCTLGAGVAPNRRDDVRAIWSYLIESSEQVETAILRLREVENRIGKMTGMSSGMFSMIDIDDWIELCRFVPSVFTKELRID